MAVALVAEHGLQAGPASAAVARGPPGCWRSSCLCGSSCSAACGIFWDQGPNQHPLRCKSDSQPLSHQGSPEYFSVVGALLCTVGCEADPWVHNEMPVASPSCDRQKRFSVLAQTNAPQGSYIENHCQRPLKLYFWSVWGRKEKNSSEDIERRLKKKTVINK